MRSNTLLITWNTKLHLLGLFEEIVDGFFLRFSSSMMAHYCQSKKRKKLKAVYRRINEFFLQKNKKQNKINKTVYKKIKVKMYIVPLLPKWQPQPSFHQRIFSSWPWERIWSSINPNLSPYFTEGGMGGIFNTGKFGVIVLSIY